MNRLSDVKFQGTSRVHIALEVADLERSIAFYRVLLGQDPVKLRPGYAKFEPAEPSVNLALNAGVGGPLGRDGGHHHFGVQVQSSDAVDAMTARFQAAGVTVRIERETACCYAVQDKVWIADPDGNRWEVFVVVQAESEHRAPVYSSNCTSASSATPSNSNCCAR